MSKNRNRNADRQPAPAAEIPLLHRAGGEAAADQAFEAAYPLTGLAAAHGLEDEASPAPARRFPPRPAAPTAQWLSYGRRSYNSAGELINDAAL